MQNTLARLTTSACLAAALLCAASPSSSADLRHYSSWLLDGGGDESLNLIAVDRDGDLFVQAYLDSASSLGPGAEGPGYCIAKLGVAGDVIWARRLVQSSTGFNVTVARAIAGTLDGGAVVTGNFSGTVNFGGAAMTANSVDIFLLKFGADGALQWQKKFGLNQLQNVADIVVDGDGSIIMTGHNTLTVDFGGGIIRSNGASDAFIAKLDASGAHMWSRGLGSAGGQEGRSLAVGSEGQIAIVFRFNGGFIDFGQGPIAALGEEDILAAVFDETGANVWALHAGGLQSEDASGAAFDPDGNAFICGTMSRPTDLGGGQRQLPPGAAGAGFVASYDATGAHRWDHVMSDSVRSFTRTIVADDFGNCFVMGQNQGTMLFGLDEMPPSLSLVLGFDESGVPLSANGYSLSMFHRFDRMRDRLLLGASANGPVDFGGGQLTPGGLDIAVVTLGVRRPAQVMILQFNARASSAGVELTWEISSGELLDKYAITRSGESTSGAEILHSGEARDGAASYVDPSVVPGCVYSYRLIVVTALGDEVRSAPVTIVVPAVINALEQNAPNPFNPLTTFAYTLAEPARVSVVIYDTRGAVIARLEQGQQPAGRHSASWGGHNMRGEFVASGVYFYRLDGVPGVGARKMVLLK